MAIFTVTSNAVENVDIFYSSSFKSGMALMRDDNGRAVPADGSLLLYKTLEQKVGKFLGFATSDYSSSSNTIIFPDVIGSSYIDNSYNYVRTENNEVVISKRALVDNQNEAINKPYNPSENLTNSRRGMAVYNQPNNIFITDQFSRVLHGDFGVDSTQIIDFNPGDLLTFGSGINAGKLVKLNVNSIGPDVLVIGIVEKFIPSTNLLHFRQVYYSISFSSSSAILAIDAGNPLSFPNSTYGTICGTAFEGNNLTLTCPFGAVFDKVIFASYGSPNGSCGAFSNGTCHAVNSISIVESYLLNNTTATIPATNGVFGDPCIGIGKKLYVEARYKFTNANDLTLYGNNGTLINGVTYSTDGGGSWSFDGTNDIINVPITSDLNSTSVTWSVWFKSSIDTAGALISKYSTTQLVLAVGPSTNTLTNELIAIVGEDNNNRVGYISSNRNELFDNTWHHIVMTAQSSFYKLYLDGRDLNLNVGMGLNNGNMTNSATYIGIGGGYSGYFLNGKISEARIYNRALSLSEIQAYYNATKGRYGL